MAAAVGASYPSTAVCYITADSGGKTWQGSGVIIGPHTVLTASHVLWDGSTQQPMTNVKVYPGFEAGGALLQGALQIHYNAIGDATHTLTRAASAQDFAIIDFATDLTAYGHFDLQAAKSGGEVHVTGYPTGSHGAQVDQTGTVSLDASEAVLDYGSLTIQSGTSGGPVWIDAGDAGQHHPTVIGVVSTTEWATQLTASDLDTIRAWQTADAFLWSPTNATAAQSAGPSSAHDVYRFYDTATGDHFYTTSPGEKAQIQASLPTYRYEGAGWASPDAGAGTTDVYRFYDTASGTHFFTTSAAERDTIVRTLSNYRYEGVAFQAYTDTSAPGTFALERFYNTQNGQHHYATPQEAAQMLQGSAGPAWIDEGKAFVVHAASGEFI
jgi:V8-like Glu-specific endopeptidase